MNRLAALVRRTAADPRPDGGLLAAFLADRDETAFAELVRRHGPLVWGVCRRALPDPADAEDAFQAAFLVLVRRAHRLTAAPTVGPWLYRVAAWTARTLRRKNARRLARTRELPAAVPDPRAHPEPPSDVDAVLLGLPERYRTAVVLCCLEGLTHREAASRLGCAEGTVSSLVSRGLSKLRSRLGGREPAALLAVAAPTALSIAAVRSAVALRLTTLSAAAPPAVAELTQGVLRMFWVKKAAAAGLAAAVLLTAGVGVGVSARSVPLAAAGDDKPTTGPTPRPAADVQALEAELKDVRAKLGEITLRSWRLTEPEIAEYGRLSGRAAELEARIKVAQAAAADPLAAREAVEVLRRRAEALRARAAAERDAAEARLRQAELELAAAEARLKEAEAKATPAGRRLVVTVGGRTSLPPVTVTEYRDGEAVWSVRFAKANWTDPDWASVREYLARARQDPNGPRSVTIEAEPAAPSKHVQAVARACRDAGFGAVEVSANIRADPDGPTGASVLLLPPGNPQAGTPVAIRVGATAQLKLKSGVIVQARRDRAGVADVTANLDDAGYATLRGVKPGEVTVYLIDQDGAEHRVRVTVTEK